MSFILQVGKTVSVLIRNELDCSLINPEAILLSGKVYSVLPEIKSGETGQILFHKTPLSLRGAVGAFVYTLKEKRIRAAIYYEVPYIGNNWFGLRWYDEAESLGEEEVSNWEEEETDMWKVDNSIKHHQSEWSKYVVRAIMSQGDHAQLEVVFKYNKK